MKKRVISILCILLVLMVVLAGCEPVTGGGSDNGSGSSSNSGSGTGGGSGSGSGTGTGGSGSGGSGSGTGSGSGSGSGTGGSGDDPNTPPVNPPAPAVSFDGTWIWSVDVPASSGIMGDSAAYSSVMQKLVIDGTTAKSYAATDAYQMGAYFIALYKGSDPDFTGPDLLPEFDSDFETGTVSVTDGVASILFLDGSESVSLEAATMAQDGNSFSTPGEDENGDPITMTFTRYTAGALDGEWVTADNYSDDTTGLLYDQVLGKIVFYGNNFQVFNTTDDYDEAVDDWFFGEEDEFPEAEYDFPYTMYGTYAVNGTAITLTLTDPPDGIPATIPGTIGTDTLSFEIDGDEQYYVKPASLVTPVRGTSDYDGYYVMTALIGGMPANERTLVISGNAIKLVTLQQDDHADNYKDQYNLSQLVTETYRIDWDQNSFTTVPENNGSPETYTIVTENDTTLVMNNGAPFEKVTPGTTGTVCAEIEIIEFGWLYYEYFFVITDYGTEFFEEQFGQTACFPFWPMSATVSGQTMNVTGINYWIDEPWNTIPAEDVTVTITIADDSIEITNVTNWPTGEGVPEDPTGTTYTRWLRTTPWPVVPAE